jgi:type IV secretion system protein VirB10
MTDNNTLINESDKAVRARSQVTPNPVYKKIKDKALFAALAIGCLVIGLVSFMPTHQKAREEAPADLNNTPNDTLSQNLKLLSEMKVKTVAMQASLDNLPTNSANHPPKLRINKVPSDAINQEILTRMNAPSTFSINANNTSSREGVSGGGEGTNNTLTGNNPNAQFVNQQDDIVSVSAKRLPHPALTVPAGELIPATLETAINSELPGMARAITTRDVYSLEGANLLIPKGSTLVGQFNANVVQGQSRLLVVWNRVQMSNGVVVTLNSPGTDTLGRAGQGADYVDRHFLERFGSGALLSIMGAFVANSGVNGQDQYNSQAQYRMAIAGSFQQAAGQTLEQDMMIRPTLQVNQGTRINVFVAHDLDFKAVGAISTHTTANVKRWGGLWKQ